MSAGATCEVCGSLCFEPSDGLFFCLECGTQSQDVREEITEEDTEALSFVRTLKAPSAKKKSRPSKTGDGQVTLLEKMQVILLKQCDALVSLGYDESVKEAVKYLWFLYLKQFGYAFIDDSESADLDIVATPTRSAPIDSSGSPSLSLKRSRHDDDDDDDPLPNPKKIKGSSNGEETTVAFDEFPEDDSLFDFSQDSFVESPTTGKGKTKRKTAATGKDKRTSVGKGKVALNKSPATPMAKSGKAVVGNDLYLLRRTERGRHKIDFFSVRFTVGLLYLGLLYARQKVLLPDLTRLVATNKIPYYNLQAVLPSHYITRKHSMSIYARNQVTSDKIHKISQILYKNMPLLPKLPQVDPKWMCHALLERLQLPRAFGTMVDRALSGVYRPEYQRKCAGLKQDTSKWKEKRPDVECMALVICIMKMIYRLDDVHEFEQCSMAVPGGESGVESLLGTGDYVYVWEDWVAVICRHFQHTLDKDVPLNARELEYVSNNQKFLDFCRLEIFTNMRPKERTGEEGRRHKFYPEYYARVSEVFRKHLSSLQENHVEDDDKKEGLYSWDNFTPRLIPLSSLLKDPDHAPWKQYIATPSMGCGLKQDFDRLPKSMVLLLELCSDVLDTTALVLMQHVRNVEWEIIRGPLETFQANQETKDPQDSQLITDTSAQDSQTQ